MQSIGFNIIGRRISTILSVVILTLTLISATTGILLSFYKLARLREFYSLFIINQQQAALTSH